MKRCFFVLVLPLLAIAMSAASYNDNKWQRMADECIVLAENAKRAGQYDEAIALAEEAEGYAEESKKFILAAEGGLDVFPEIYITGTWAQDRDCLWNIAGRPYVYNNPWQWKKLYTANKDTLPQPDNPDLIKPGESITIPSLRGEKRSGTYDPQKKWGTMKP